MLRISNLTMPVAYTSKALTSAVCKALHCKADNIRNLRLAKKSIDARKKDKLCFILSVDVELENEAAYERRLKDKNIKKVEEYKYRIPSVERKSEKRPVVVGMGPAGLFAALILAQAGLKPILIERGKPVEERSMDISAFWDAGKLDGSSNVQFGEGGAGTFSDGKLTTGIKDARCRKVLEEFYQAGAPEEILYLAKPHIGTDKLRIVVKNMREKLIALGAEIHFQTRLEAIHADSSQVLTHITVDKNGEKQIIETDALILAIGHSARDTFEMLYSAGLNMQQKAFSVGARIEHKQELINRSQYGSSPDAGRLGAADYKLSVHLENGRGVYTFCMCPGGQVVAAASESGGVVTNGMSVFARDAQNANSALLVGVGPGDFESDHPLAGMYFQRDIEQKAFAAGGENYFAPAQLVGDFLNNTPSVGQQDVTPSYAPGVRWTALESCLPDFVTQSMREAIPLMDKKLHGFAYSGAVLTAAETRSSSPVRILRNEKLQANIAGVYPCGEGAGYAGGIVSSAVDGIRCAESILSAL